MVDFPGFPLSRESSEFNMLWMPDQVLHDGFGTFYESIKVILKNCHVQVKSEFREKHNLKAKGGFRESMTQ